MIYYSVLLGLYAFCSLLGFNPTQKRQRLVYVTFLLLPVFILIAFRSTSVGVDTLPYARAFEKFSSMGSIRAVFQESYMESGYCLLEFAFGHLGFSYYGFQFVLASIYCFSFGRFFSRYSNNPAMSCFLLLSMQGMFGMMNQTRMWLAISILLFAYEPLRQRRLLRFVLVVILASTIHTSAAVFIFVYPLMYIYKKQKVLCVLLSALLGLLVAILGNRFFSVVFSEITRYESYADSSWYGLGFAAIVFLVEYGIIYGMSVWSNKRTSMCVSDQTGENTSNLTTTYDATLEETICLLAFVFSLACVTNSFMTRVIGFFAAFVYVFFANSITRSGKRSGVPIAEFFAILLFSLQMYVILLARPYWDRVLPYVFYFWE